MLNRLHIHIQYILRFLLLLKLQTYDLYHRQHFQWWLLMYFAILHSKHLKILNKDLYLNLYKLILENFVLQRLRTYLFQKRRLLESLLRLLLPKHLQRFRRGKSCILHLQTLLNETYGVFDRRHPFVLHYLNRHLLPIHLL